MDKKHRKPGSLSLIGSGLKTGPMQRNTALARLGLEAGGQFMVHSIGNVFRRESARAEANRRFYKTQSQALSKELGRLKGSAMKAGQMLSLYGQYFLPEEAVSALAELQESADPVPWSSVVPVLRRSIGAQRLAELDIDEKPIAAASMGQVHYAIRKRDGLEIAIKIQYPGVATAIDSDIGTLSRILSLSRLVPREFDMSAILDEVRTMLHREVDYGLERKFTECYGQLLRCDQRFVVPEVLGEYCSDRVLATTFEVGTSVRSEPIQALSLRRRNRLASAMVDLFLREFFEWGHVQTDPHFGNYRFCIGETEEEDRIVLLDFGATRRFDPAFVRGYSKIVHGAVRHDKTCIVTGASEIGLMTPDHPESVLEGFRGLCELLVEPFNDHISSNTPRNLLNESGEYRWAASDLPGRASRLLADNALSAYFRIPPREIIFLHRRLVGTFLICAALRGEFNARSALLQQLDGLAA